MTELNTIPLFDLIETLRFELAAAKNAATDKEVRFDVEMAEIEVQVVAKREAGGGGKFKLYILEAGGEAKIAKEVVQKVRLQLKPRDRQGGKITTTG